MGLKLEEVSKTWPGFTLNNISLTVEDGEYFFILGPTGAGKTLLLETIMGFYKPDKGRILLDGQDVTNVPPEKRGIGYVSQSPMLFPHMTVRQNIEFGLRMRKTSDKARNKMVDEVLTQTGLKNLEGRRPDGLSGGERQKVTLARVIAIQPKTIILDEPLAAVDAETAGQLKRELKRIHEEGKTIIHVTHNQVEAFSLGDKMAIMNRGSIAQAGKTRDVFLNPRNEFAARFLGYENVYEAHLVSTGKAASLVSIGRLLLKVSEQVSTDCVIGIRPEDVEVETSPLRGGSANILEGSVIDWTDMGAIVTVNCNVGFVLKAIMTKSSFIKKDLKEGQNVWVAFKNENVKVIQL